MDSLDDFEPTDTTGFVAIQTIRYVLTQSLYIWLEWKHQLIFPVLQSEEVRSPEGRGGRVPQPCMNYE